MAGRGPAPKPAQLRQRRNKRAGIATLEPQTVGSQPPQIPNPDGRTWHPLTLASWRHAWASPMASQWIETDVDVLGRLACLWDAFYCRPDKFVLAEIRLQEQRFGLSPLDRTRLSWEFAKTEKETQKPAKPEPAKRQADPRRMLRAVK